MENVIGLLERLVEENPDGILFVDDSRSYTRRGVYERACCIASALLRAGAREEPVLIRVDRSAKSIIAILGIALSGNYYVPIDLYGPEQRLEAMARLSEARFEVSFHDLPSPVVKIDYEESLSSLVDMALLEEARRAYHEEKPLMLLFTSGSTGMPKGVLKSHGSVLSFLGNFHRTFPFVSSENIANQAPFYFDASNKDIFLTLSTGSTLYLPEKSVFALPTATLEYLNANKITMICWVPSVLSLIAKMKALRFIKPETLRYIFFVGEAFLPKYLNMWLQDYPEARYFNLYGSTEVTGVCLYHEVTSLLEEGKPLPTGKPLEGNEVYLKDGEIVVCSPQLAIGYLKDEEKNKTVFQIRGDGRRELHTGDYGEIDENGDIVYHGRKDFQVKHMGYRIELQEVELNLSAFPYIEEVACVLNRLKDQLYAYCVINDKTIENPVKKIIGDAKEKLPNYMVPNKIIVLDALPLNKNGKVDRTYLREKAEE